MCVCVCVCVFGFQWECLLKTTCESMCAWLVGLLETLEAIFGRQRFCTCVVCWGRSNLAELTGFPVQVLGMGNGQNTFPQFGFFMAPKTNPPVVLMTNLKVVSF